MTGQWHILANTHPGPLNDISVASHSPIATVARDGGINCQELASSWQVMEVNPGGPQIPCWDKSQ